MRIIDDVSGNFATVFAICAVPVLGLVALAVDYSGTLTTKSAIQNAADAAILAGVRESQQRVLNGASLAQAELQGERLARDFFVENVAELGLTYSGAFSVDIVASGGRYAGTATYAGTADSLLGSIVNFDGMDFEVMAVANITGQQYNEVHFVIDNSASMGVGADAASIAAMAGAINCAFACHVPTAGIAGFSDTHIAARNAGATLRIDAVKSATADIIDYLETKASGDLLQVAVHTFSNSLDTVQTPTTDLNRVRTRLNGLELTNQNYEGGTNFHEVMRNLRTAVGRSGDGSTPSDRRKTVVLITDGVATNIRYDSAVPDIGTADPRFVAYAPVMNGAPGDVWSSQGFDGSICRDMKDRDEVTLMTLNVEYVIPTVGTDGDTRFDQIRTILKPNIRSSLQGCASVPALSQVVGNSADIDDALMDLFQNLEAYNLRLTN